MIRHLILALALLPSIAHAQTTQDGFVVPTDILATTGIYVDQFDGYASGSTENQIGDGSNARGGTMPVLADQPADIPAVASGWITIGATDFVTITDPDTEEAKMRLVASRSHEAFDDPIRNFAQPGTSHCHTFFGNTSTNAYSTYASLRTRANERSAVSKAASTAAGGPYQATAYWHPCIIKPNAFGDGLNYAVRVTDYVIYYVENPARPAENMQRLPRGLRYVFGLNMDDPYDTELAADIAAANAQSGTAGRYSALPVPYNNGFIGYKCLNAAQDTLITATGGATHYPGFKTAAGADPWAGACVAGSWLIAELNGPQCYDGVNLWSPGGYKHFRRVIVDSVGTHQAKGCPNGWFRLPSIVITMSMKHQGFADYGTWYLSSDASATARAQTINPAAPAMRPGESFHTDWMNGWDDTELLRWQEFCFGIPSGGTMHTCANGSLDATHRLLGGAGGNAPDGSRVPQISLTTYTTLLRSDMILLPTSLTGPHAIQAN